MAGILQGDQRAEEGPDGSGKDDTSDAAVQLFQRSLFGGRCLHLVQILYQQKNERDQAEIHGAERAGTGCVKRRRKTHDHPGSDSTQENQFAENRFHSRAPDQINADQDEADSQDVEGQRNIFRRIAEIVNCNEPVLKQRESVKLRRGSAGKQSDSQTGQERNSRDGAVHL